MLRARCIVAPCHCVFERLPAWSYTVTDECLTRRIGGVGAAARRWRRSKRFNQRIRAFDSLKAKKLSPASREEAERGWKRWRGRARRIGSQSQRGGRGTTGGESRGGRCARVVGKRLHYVRDRAKLLGTWIIETKLSHLCLQSSRYFKRSCTHRTASRRVALNSPLWRSCVPLVRERISIPAIFSPLHSLARILTCRVFLLVMDSLI